MRQRPRLSGLPLLLLPLLLLGCSGPGTEQVAPATTASPPENPATSPDALTIGTWNLEWFGQRREPGPRTDADLAVLGETIRTLGVKVLAVQEIANEAALQRLCSAVGPTWRHVLGTTGGWRDSPNRQAIGFCFDNKRVELLHAEELLQLPRRLEDVPIFHRIPVTACFRDRVTGADFRLVTVHFKASRGPVNEQKRRLEATELASWLRQLQNDGLEDQDYLVLGDFNCTYGTEPQQALERGAVTQWLPQVSAEPTIMHFPEPIDHLACSPSFAEVDATTFDSHAELAGTGAAERDAFRRACSDHFPVTVSLVSSADDDPDARFTKGPQSQWLPGERR